MIALLLFLPLFFLDGMSECKVQERRKGTLFTEDNKGLLGFLSSEKCQERLYEQVPQNNSMPWKL